MSDLDSSDIIQRIDECFESHLRCRSVFPAIRESAAGLTEIEPPEYYNQHGFNAKLVLDRPLAIEDIRDLNAVARRLNQSYVIYLYALIETHQVVRKGKPINTSTPGGARVEILKKLRNQFMHGSLQCRLDESKERTLYDRIASEFGGKSAPADGTIEWWLPIDKVLAPLTAACRDYASGKK